MKVTAAVWQSDNPAQLERVLLQTLERRDPPQFKGEIVGQFVNAYIAGDRMLITFDIPELKANELGVVTK